VILGVRPSAVRLAAEGLPAIVTMSEALGEESFANLSMGELLVRAKVAQRPAERSRVHIQLDERALHVFDRSTGIRL
jgi:ABC-type sugar transport system ATPase subunit